MFSTYTSTPTRTQHPIALTLLIDMIGYLTSLLITMCTHRSPSPGNVAVGPVNTKTLNGGRNTALARSLSAARDIRHRLYCARLHHRETTSCCTMTTTLYTFQCSPRPDAVQILRPRLRPPLLEFELCACVCLTPAYLRFFRTVRR